MAPSFTTRLRGPVQQAAGAAPRALARRRPRECPVAAVGAGADGPRICVLGAGVNGLATALRLLREVPGVQLTVLAERFGTDTTTAGAAGIWGPYKLSDTPQDDVLRWVVVFWWGRVCCPHKHQPLRQPASRPVGQQGGVPGHLRAPHLPRTRRAAAHGPAGNARTRQCRWSSETYDHLMTLWHSEHAAAAGISLCYAHTLHEASDEPDPFYAGAWRRGSGPHATRAAFHSHLRQGGRRAAFLRPSLADCWRVC
jgi:hypothetical protein